MRDYKEVVKANRVNIIGVPITSTNMEETLDVLVDHINEIRGEYVCVSNVHTTVMASDNSDYWVVQASSLMSVPDGKPLSLLGSKTHPTMDRVTGPDLMRAIFDNPVGRGMRHYFYGNQWKNLDMLRLALLEEYPDLNIVGMEPSVFRPLYDEEKIDLCSRINKSKADYVWVALGAPRQEILCYELMGKTNAVMIGVGGAFNILAGITPEAPAWMQHCSLEWLYRLLQEPRRLFGRYLVTNTKFIAYCLFKKKPAIKVGKES